MKKHYLLLLFLLISKLFIGGEIPKEQAREVAKNLLFERTNLKLSEINFSDEYTKQENGKNLFYIFNVENNNGFVIVSAEENSDPILAYSNEGNFNYNNIPIQISGLLENYSNQINVIRDNNISSVLDIQQKWVKYLVADVSLKERYMQKKAVSPLLTTRWNQNSGWNDSCPVASAGPGGNVYAGCVATATGQVMKYHSFPSQGHGSRTYTHDTYGSLKANFGNSTYNFASMPNNTYSSETAKLLYHIGVSVQMDYGTGASSASIVDIAETIGYFFNYKVDSLKEKSSYLNDAAWTTALKGELDESRPLIYRGYGPAGGHAFVADGYDADDKIHFNFGWSGSGDGYYSVAMINPTVSSTTYTFNNEQGAIFGMTPNITPITGTAITPSCSSNTVNLVNTNGFGIFNVALEDINNASGGTVNDNNNFGGNGYLDFSSSKNTVLETSTTYTISVTLGTINYEYARVYIDYNNNGSFENNGELITSFSGSNAKGLKTASFTTPASPTFETLLRMRVISDYNSTINSCGRTTVTPGQLQYGQAEDYGIYFNTNLGISNNNILSEKVKIYPNPVNDIIRINSENNYSIVLRDINGRELIKRNNFSKDDLINVSSLENGIYLIEIFNNSERYIQKIIKN